ncbi:ABC transporter substrate-binding protein [Falsochrobactrum shanghaiense]|uniref:ABC transporter substrate-binding protein n=1 Tax=Falsochrobactrum shanghaiense TaxID=2201899 RepID=A0A316J6S0_9HYPH|nr:extracellular solute-binding protein [Falsochrobactrum shanghaiense]PWL17612.1 ABC transporter substrate-binding protein [Falsochrobactrum shanghaiense]
MLKLSRRQALGGLAAVATLPATRLFAQSKLALPTSPVSINIVDVAGNLALTQKAIENYVAAKPELVSRVTFTKAPAPELPGKLKAQQAANRLDIDLVLTGADALAAGLEMDLWVKLLPDHSDSLPDLASIYLEPAHRMLAFGQDHGVVVTYYPSGPLLEYMPDKVKNVPKNAAELLEWAKQNPNKFIYARPANSGPGRTFLMGLPYLLGDSDPKDPVKGWDKTWEYLKELHQYIEYYPTGTGALMKELGEGTRDMTVTTTGWDINPRVLGVVPKEAAVAKLDGFSWVADAQFMAVPKGVSDEKLAVVLDLMSFLLTPEQQAYTYDEGYFYPGPAVKDVPLSMAPQSSQDAIAEYGRPEYADWIANNPVELPLDPAAMVIAFRRWDEEVASLKK